MLKTAGWFESVTSCHIKFVHMSFPDPYKVFWGLYLISHRKLAVPELSSCWEQEGGRHPNLHMQATYVRELPNAAACSCTDADETRFESVDSVKPFQMGTMTKHIQADAANNACQSILAAKHCVCVAVSVTAD